MNDDFRDGYGVGADEQLAGQARLGRDLLSRCGGARAQQSHASSTARMSTGFMFDGRRATGVKVRIGGEEKTFTAREVICSLGGIHSPHFLMQDGHRAGRASARARHRGARRHAGRRPEPVQPRHRVPRHAAEARHAAVGAHPPARDDVLPLFLRPAGRAAHRHVHQRAVQDVVEPARACGRQSRRRPCSSRCRAARFR